jgi:hypothetical protein
VDRATEPGGSNFMEVRRDRYPALSIAAGGTASLTPRVIEVFVEDYVV